MRRFSLAFSCVAVCACHPVSTAEISITSHRTTCHGRTFAVTANGVFRKPGTSECEAVDSPSGGNAVAGRSATDLIIAGPPGVSIRRVK